MTEIKPAESPGEREVLTTYLARKMGVPVTTLLGLTPYVVLGVVRDDQLMGAALFINKRMNTIELAWAGEKGWMTPGVLRAIWSYPFNQLKCLTVTSYIRPDNVVSQDFVERMGAYRCGEVPHAFGQGVPGYHYVMERDKCRWLLPHAKEEEDVKLCA